MNTNDKNRVTCAKCGAVYRVCTRVACSKDQRQLGQTN